MAFGVFVATDVLRVNLKNDRKYPPGVKCFIETVNQILCRNKESQKNYIQIQTKEIKFEALYFLCL